jgi:hypothetical protein
LFFLVVGLPPPREKNTPHVRKVLLAAAGGYYAVQNF